MHHAERSSCDIGGDKMVDEVILPGFRFHPTDEELVGFYLKRKVQHRPLSIELIKQLDIYKFDPWDLPKLAASGEKEWYFYCPRDRKYRNSTRPNRVTGAGFWKATGTDRPIYSSDGPCSSSSKCIGLKKSLVFYKGRAAKGVKTDWMMHEFRLPSLTDSLPPKRSSSFIDKTIPANDSWAICRIFKKTNASNAHQRTFSHHHHQSWVSSLPETNACQDMMGSKHHDEFSSESMSLMNHNNNNELQISSTTTSIISPLDIYNSTNNSYKPILNPFIKVPYPYFPISTNSNIISNGIISDYFSSTTTSSPSSFTFSSSPLDTSSVPSTKCAVDVSSLLLNMSSSMLGDYSGGNNNIKASAAESTNNFDDFISNGGFSSSMTMPHHHGNPVMQGNNSNLDDNAGVIKNIVVPNGNLNLSAEETEDQQWEMTSVRSSSIGFPLMIPVSIGGGGGGDGWKSSSLTWESSPCPSEMSTSRCYT